LCLRDKKVVGCAFCAFFRAPLQLRLLMLMVGHLDFSRFITDDTGF
jgi:hypothetical protein